MLTVRDNELMVEEKGVQSVEKFIIARRLMYWQVYLHKTVLAAEMLLINIFKRAKKLAQEGHELFATPAFKYFLYKDLTEASFKEDPRHLDQFLLLDDTDVMASIKVWQTHEDKILSRLCKMLILRKLYKIVLSGESLANILWEKRTEAMTQQGINEEDLKYFVFAGIATNSTYNIDNELIKIEMKNGSIRNITELDDTLVNQTVARAIHKNYICFVQS
jgi:hypothetical protein